MISKDNPCGEVRLVDPTTGGEKGLKLARFDLIPFKPLWALAELYGRGLKKYAPRNWEKGYAWSLSFASMMRHAWLFWNGEDYDACGPDCPPDCKIHTGSHHLDNVAWHAFTLREYFETHKELDDRPNKKEKS